MTTQEKIAVMQQFDAGKKIEYKTKGSNQWCNSDTPIWNFADVEYRVEPNKFHVIDDMVKESEVASTMITFGLHEHFSIVNKSKLLYDSHIRRTLENEMSTGDTIMFRLVATTPKAHKLLEIINKSKFAK